MYIDPETEITSLETERIMQVAGPSYDHGENNSNPAPRHRSNGDVF